VQDPLYDSLLYEHRTAFFTYQQHKSSHLPHSIPTQPEEFQIFIAAPSFNLSCSSTGFGSNVNFTNSLFFKHCQQNILNYSQTMISGKQHNHMILE